MRKRRRSNILFILLFVVPVAAFAQQGAASLPAAPPLKVFRDIDGRGVRLKSYRGQVVLLNFWATWCPPCRAEIPELVELQHRYRNKLQIIGITHPPEKRGDIVRLARELKINYPVVLGTRRTASLFRVGGVLPVTVIIDRQGRVRDTVLGILEPEEFEQKIKPLLR